MQDSFFFHPWMQITTGSYLLFTLLQLVINSNISAQGPNSKRLALDTAEKLHLPGRKHSLKSTSFISHDQNMRGTEKCNSWKWSESWKSSGWTECWHFTTSVSFQLGTLQHCINGRRALLLTRKTHRPTLTSWSHACTATFAGKQTNWVLTFARKKRKHILPRQLPHFHPEFS